MEVEIAEERILVLSDRFSGEVARAKSWAHRIEAFGTMAKLGGFLNRPKDDEFELTYSERRLQPFWRIASCAVSSIRAGPATTPSPPCAGGAEGGDRRPGADHRGAPRITLRGHESCREELRPPDAGGIGLTGQEDARLEVGLILEFTAAEADAAHLAAMAQERGRSVVPPAVKASGLVRDAVAKAIGKIDADRVLEESVTLEAVDLYYRPVYAFRYRRAAKEAVVEFDALTGEVKTAGSTFEQHLGKILEPKFLLDISAEAANIFIPGATVAKLAFVKGLELRDKHRLAKPS